MPKPSKSTKCAICHKANAGNFYLRVLFDGIEYWVCPKHVLED